MKLLGPIILVTLAIFLGIFSSGRVFAQNSDDFLNEEDAHDDVPIGGSGGTEQRDTNQEGGTVDFNNGDKGCDNDHQNCKHVANHGSNNQASNSDTPMTKLINNLQNGCMVVKGPTTTERVAGIRTTVEITCEG
jgi:hypothetical protein